MAERATLTVVVGGTRSGKSAIAESLLPAGGDAVYVATGAADDPEMELRIAAHRRRRPDRWRTVETDDVAGALAGGGVPALVDSVGSWVRARMDALDLWEEGDLTPLVEDAAGWMSAADGPVVVVAEQVGEGVVPLGVGTRRWVDTVGEVTRVLVAQSDRALLVVAGRAIDLLAAGDVSPADPADLDDLNDLDDLDDLGRHGDAMVPDGAVDLAVNVRPGGPPPHIRRALRDADAGRYPSQAATREAVAGHLGLSPDNVLLLAGAAEAFWLLPHALRFRHAAVVHPSFTAPEAALRACQVPVTRVPRDAGAGWALRPERVPEDADLVVLGNPNNPTGTLDEPGEIVGLCRDDRTVVVDEAFMDFVVDNRSSLAGAVRDRRLVVVRSVTKLWSVPGVRAGYLTGPADLVARLRAHQQPWPVSAAALAVITAAIEDETWRQEAATGVAAQRSALVRRLSAVSGVTVHDGAANFVLIEVDAGPAVHRALLARGIAVRPSTFPFLSPGHLRVAVTDAVSAEHLALTLEELL